MQELVIDAVFVVLVVYKNCVAVCVCVGCCKRPKQERCLVFHLVKALSTNVFNSTTEESTESHLVCVEINVNSPTADSQRAEEESDGNMKREK